MIKCTYDPVTQEYLQKLIIGKGLSEGVGGGGASLGGVEINDTRPPFFINMFQRYFGFKSKVRGWVAPFKTIGENKAVCQ